MDGKFITDFLAQKSFGMGGVRSFCLVKWMAEDAFIV